MTRTALALALLLATGAAAAPPAAAAAASATPEAAIVDRWQGTYLCTQGWTGLDLTIERDPEAPPAGRLKATFAFYEIARNPGVPSGRFTMRGHFDPEDGHLDLAQEAWLERPPQYVMVDLHGALDPEQDTLEGRVSGPGCGAFSLRRAQGDPTADSWLLGK